MQAIFRLIPWLRWMGQAIKYHLTLHINDAPYLGVLGRVPLSKFLSTSTVVPPPLNWPPPPFNRPNQKFRSRLFVSFLAITSRSIMWGVNGCCVVLLLLRTYYHSIDQTIQSISLQPGDLLRVPQNLDRFAAVSLDISAS